MKRLDDALWSRDFITVGRLLNGGADVNAVVDYDDSGYTPLHIASIQGCVTSIRLLVQFGANLLARDSEGETAWDVACSYNQEDARKLLIELLSELYAAEKEREIQQDTYSTIEADRY